MKPLRLLLALPFLLLGACGGSAEPTLLPDPAMQPSGAVTAVVPTPTETPLPDGIVHDPVTALVERAVVDLATRQGADYPSVEVLNVEPVEWPDAALGCPTEGYDYAQVITPGYRITLLIGDVAFSYHSDRDGSILLCETTSASWIGHVKDESNVQDGWPNETRDQDVIVRTPTPR